MMKTGPALRSLKQSSHLSPNICTSGTCSVISSLPWERNLQPARLAVIWPHVRAWSLSHYICSVHVARSQHLKFSPFLPACRPLQSLFSYLSQGQTLPSFKPLGSLVNRLIILSLLLEVSVFFLWIFRPSLDIGPLCPMLSSTTVWGSAGSQADTSKLTSTLRAMTVSSPLQVPSPTSGLGPS